MTKIIAARRFIYFLAVAALLTANFATGICTGMKDAVPGARDRQIFYIAAAISSVVFHIHGYVANDLVRQTLIDNGMDEPATETEPSRVAHFTDAKKLAAAVDAARRLPRAKVAVAHNSIIVYEDLGYIQFLDWMYRIFGVHVASAYYGYFLVLGISVLPFFLFPVASDAVSLAIVSIFLTAHWAVLPAIGQLSEALSVTNARFIGTLGVLPLAYVLCAVFRKFRLRSITMLGVLIECAILGFLPFVRITALWTLLLFFAAIIALALHHLWQRLGGREPVTPIRSDPRLRSAGVICAIVLAFLGVTKLMASERAGPEYARSGVGYHTVWDNAFIAFDITPGWDQQFACVYGGGRGDYVGITAAERQLRADNLPESVWRQNGGIKPEYYSKALRQVYLSFLWHHPLFVAETYLYYRPQQFFNAFHRLWRLGVRREICNFIPIATIFMLCVILAFASQVRSLIYVTSVTALIWIFSGLPEFLATPSPHLLAETAVLTIALLYAVVLLSAVSFARIAGGRIPLPDASASVPRTSVFRHWDLALSGAFALMVLSISAAQVMTNNRPVTAPATETSSPVESPTITIDGISVPVVSSIPMPSAPAENPLAGYGRLPQAVSASSSLSNEDAPPELFNDDDQAYWAIAAGSGLPEEWLTIDLGAGEATPARTVRMKPRFDDPREFFAVANLAGSSDGVTWRPLAELRTAPFPINSPIWLGWNLPPAPAYRYYRFTFPQTGSLQFCSIGKVIMY